MLGRVSAGRDGGATASGRGGGRKQPLSPCVRDSEAARMVFGTWRAAGELYSDRARQMRRIVWTRVVDRPRVTASRLSSDRFVLRGWRVGRRRQRRERAAASGAPVMPRASQKK